MNRRRDLKNLIIFFGSSLLILTAVEYLVRAFSVTLDPGLAYWTQIIYLLSIFLFLILLVIYIEVRMRSES
jgi:predicted membrane channel-forming protein YqfA (hemolysin III family)